MTCIISELWKDKDKEAELSSASLQRLTPWYLEERLKDCNVHINENYYGEKDGVKPTQEHVVDGTFKCYNNYEEGDKEWRVPNQRELSVMYLVDKDKIKNTYCRTIFSNTNFRKSWTYDGSIFTMNVSSWTATGSVRCIKVQK